MAERKSSFLGGCLTVIGALIVLIAVFIGGCAMLLNEGMEEVKKEKEIAKKKEIAKVNNIKIMKPSPIPWSEVNNIYKLGSKYTDLQKDSEWKRYEGKKIRWSGKVAEISDSFSSLSLQIKMNRETFTSDLIIYLNESERSKALSVSKGDIITFTGILDSWGTLLPITLKYGMIE